jgi:hypothetical protein
MAKANEIVVRILATGKEQTVDAWETPVCRVWHGHRESSSYRGGFRSRRPREAVMPCDVITDSVVTVGGAEMQRNPRYGAQVAGPGDLVWVVIRQTTPDGRRLAYAGVVSE